MHPRHRRPRPLAALFAAAALCTGLPALAAQITDVRIGAHPKFTRVVFELDGRAGYRIERAGTDAAPELRITIEAQSSTRELRAVGDVRGVKVDAGTKARARIALRDAGLRVHEMMLSDPPRIVVDLLKSETAVAATAKPEPAKPKAEAKESPKVEPKETLAAAPKESPKVEPKETLAPAPKETAKAEPKQTAKTEAKEAPKSEAKETPAPAPAPKVAPPPSPAPVAPKTAAAPPAPPAPPKDAAVNPPAPAPAPAPAVIPAPRVTPPPSTAAQTEKPAPPPATSPPKPAPSDAAHAVVPPAPAPTPIAPPAVTPAPTPDSAAKLQPPPPVPTPAPSPVRPTPAPVPAPAPHAMPAQPPALAPSWSDRLPRDPIWIGGIAAALLGLAAIGIVRRRRRALPNDLDVTAIAEEIEQTSESPGRIPSGGFAMGDDDRTSAAASDDSSFAGLFDKPAETAAPAAPPEPMVTPPTAVAAAEDSLFDDAGEMPGEPDVSEGDAPMNQEMDLPVDRRTTQPAAQMGGSAAAPSPDLVHMLQDMERRIATLEARLDESNEAREKLERQVAAQSEELRVQRAAIARTQRALRTMTRGEEDKATEPALRDGATQAKTRVTP